MTNGVRMQSGHPRVMLDVEVIMNANVNNPTVINALVENQSWLGELAQAMERRQEIVLLANQLDSGKRAEVDRLRRRHGYTAPASVPPEQWNEFRMSLPLTAFASKEQEISSNVVQLLAPS